VLPALEGLLESGGRNRLPEPDPWENERTDGSETDDGTEDEKDETLLS
jgi:hypothetical protein